MSWKSKKKTIYRLQRYISSNFDYFIVPVIWTQLIHPRTKCPSKMIIEYNSCSLDPNSQRDKKKINSYQLGALTAVW